MRACYKAPFIGIFPIHVLRPPPRLVAFGVISILLLGCSPGAYLGLSANNATLQRHSVLVVRVTNAGTLPPEAMAVLYQRRASGERLIRYSGPTGPDSFLFLVAPGERYQVAVFLDRNRNLRIDDGEPLGWAWHPDGVEPHFGDRIVLGETQLSPDKTLGSGFERDLTHRGAKQATDLPVVYGEVADLNSAIFSPAYGRKGYWRAAEFLREAGVGVYFLEPYQPTKIPVLFVYGVNGTPLNFKAFFDNLDRDRYQPWFFHYPTGVRIDDAGTTLFEIVRSLQAQYGFTRMHVVAHSMGGLVARDMLAKFLHDDQTTFVRMFISLSTPWGGIASTTDGVRRSPFVIPAWIDLQPEGRFLGNLYTTSLKPRVEFHLLYGHRASRFGFLDDDESDGTVTVESQLDNRARRDAVQVLGFEEDHDSILKSQAVVAAVNAALRRADRGSATVSSARQ